MVCFAGRFLLLLLDRALLGPARVVVLSLGAVDAFPLGLVLSYLAVLFLVA